MIQNELKLIYPDLVNEHQVSEGFYYVDIFVPSLNLSIEINGPSHVNSSGHLKLKYKKRRKLLQKLGLRIVEIDAVRMY
jgi:very-short-patch-repair endonuclease